MIILKKNKWRIFFASFSLFTFAGCGSSDRQQDQPETKFSQDDFTKFSKRIEQSLDSGNASFFQSSVDIVSMTDKILKDSELSSSEQGTLGTALSTAISEIGEQLAKSAAAGARYRFLHLISKDGKTTALFRFFSKDGLNYHRLELNGKNGKIGIEDIYVFLTGEMLSKTVKNVLSTAMSGTGDAGNEANLLNGMREAMASGKFEEALADYKTLPENLSKTKAVELYHVMICARLGNAGYMEAIHEYEQLFPGDPSIDLVSIDGLIMNREYKKALASIDRLDSVVKDPFLDYFRGNMYYRMDNMDLALKYLTQAEKIFPGENADAYYTIAEIDISKKKNYKEACVFLSKLKKNSSVTDEEIESQLSDLLLPATYKKFISSEEYKGMKGM